MPESEIASYLDSLRDRLDKHRVALSSALEHFYSTLGPRLEDVRSEWQQVESESAPRFNACRLLQPDENGLSRAIAELLRPNGRHGQGKVFLDLFLDQIGYKELTAGSSGATVRTEEFASGAPEGGRIDITVRIGAFCVAIENKPWAGDQPSQLHRYAEHLRTRREDFCLVYVNKCGDPPPSDSIPEAERDELERAGRFKILSYAGGFRYWLQACRNAARPENVRSLIDSLSSYLDEEGPVTREEKNEILEHAFEDPKRLRIALLVGAAFQDLCQRLFKERADELERRLRARLGPDWEFRTDSRPSGRFSFCLRKSAWPKPMEFGFRRDSERGPFYLWLRKWNAPEKGAIDERLNGELRAVIGAGGPWESFSWWRSVDDDHNWSRIDVLQELATSGNEPVTYVADHLELMARTIDPIIEREISARSAASSATQ